MLLGMPALLLMVAARPAALRGDHSLEQVEGVNSWVLGRCGQDFLREIRQECAELGLEVDAGRRAAEARAEAARRRLQEAAEAAARGGAGGGAGAVFISRVGPRVAQKKPAGASAEASFRQWEKGETIAEVAASKRDNKGLPKPLAPSTVLSHILDCGQAGMEVDWVRAPGHPPSHKNPPEAPHVPALHSAASAALTAPRAQISLRAGAPGPRDRPRGGGQHPRRLGAPPPPARPPSAK